MNSFLELITSESVALALIDYQPAMYFGVQSHDRLLVMQNANILAEAAKLFKVPTILTSVAQDSFSGPFSNEIAAVFPKQIIIDRTSINAWLDPNFQKAVEETKRKKIVLAGLWTEACVMFPALDLLKKGFTVYVPTDACGDVSCEAHERSVQRLIQAGAIPITSLQFLFELQQDWKRSESYEGVMEILKKRTPYGIQVAFSKWALGEHASEAGVK